MGFIKIFYLKVSIIIIIIIIRRQKAHIIFIIIGDFWR